MAISSTLYRFSIEWADMDHHVYESLDLRVPCHPSEDGERLVVRILARTLAHQEGLEFGRGLSHAEDPALWCQSLTGEVKTWIDVGIPSAERLHKANKRADKVLIFSHKLGVAMQKEWSSRSIHKPDTIELTQLPVHLVSALANDLERSNTWFVNLQEGRLSVSYEGGQKSVEGDIVQTTLSDFLKQ